jgi:protein involved in polysaccharide export with SLBB domain
MPAWVVSLFLLLVGSARWCAAAGSTNIFASGTNTSYVLAVNDLVEIKVYKEDDLATKTRVDQDGTISLPLIKTVPVSGRTIAEAREIIRQLYENDYLVSASVMVTLIESSRTNKAEAKPKLKFTVHGQVKKPGVVEIPEGEKVDLVNAIALAGDFTPLANKRKVTVKRREGDALKVYELDVQSMLRDVKARPFEVRPGDLIEVRQTLF